MNGDRCAVLAAAGALLASLFGGWDGAMITLCVFMLADYLSGVVLAGVFRRSKHSASGALESRAGLKGLCRKAGMMLVVIVAARLDIMCSLGGVLRAGTIFALSANEALSIIENLGAMGVPLPAVLRRAIERLEASSDDRETKD